MLYTNSSRNPRNKADLHSAEVIDYLKMHNNVSIIVNPPMIPPNDGVKNGVAPIPIIERKKLPKQVYIFDGIALVVWIYIFSYKLRTPEL